MTYYRSCSSKEATLWQQVLQGKKNLLAVVALFPGNIYVADRMDSLPVHGKSMVALEIDLSHAAEEDYLGAGELSDGAFACLQQVGWLQLDPSLVVGVKGVRVN